MTSILPAPEPMLASTVIRFTRKMLDGSVQDQQARLLAWCRARCGPEATTTGMPGTWCWSWLDGDSVVVTLPGDEVIFELHMVEPWRSP